MQCRCDWERNEYGNKEETGYNAKQTLRTLHSISTLIPSILLLLLVLLRGVVHVDPLVDETPHIGFFICFDEQGIATQRADDPTLLGFSSPDTLWRWHRTRQRRLRCKAGLT